MHRLQFVKLDSFRKKAKAAASIAVYKRESVQKGTGRFGPFIKWDGLFINVSKKYNFDT